MEISIIALPLIASIISGFFGKFIGDRKKIQKDTVNFCLKSIKDLI